MCGAVSCRSPLCFIPVPPRGVSEGEVMLVQMVFDFHLKYMCMLMLALDLYMHVLSFPGCCHDFEHFLACRRNSWVVIFSTEAPQSVVMVMERFVCKAML